MEIEPVENVVVLTYIKHARGTVWAVHLLYVNVHDIAV